MTVKEFIARMGIDVPLKSNNAWDKQAYIDFCSNFISDTTDKDLCHLSEKQRKLLIDIAIHFSNSPVLKKRSKKSPQS